MRDPYGDRKLVVEELPKITKSFDQITKTSKNTEAVLLKCNLFALVLVLVIWDVVLWGAIFGLW